MSTRHLHVEVCFAPEGGTKFFRPNDATHAEREEIASRLAEIVRVLAAHPEAVRCAAGCCDGTCGHSIYGGLA